MEWDWKIRITDIIMVFAIVLGPIIAVQITEMLRASKDARNRKVHIFRNLMATRSAQLAAMHIEALNLVELEFQSKKHRKTLDAWRLYVDHLKDRAYPKETWPTRKSELLVDLLYEMSCSLGYNFDKVQIKSGSYYPSGYEDNDLDTLESRKLWLEVLRGKRHLPMVAGVYNLPPKEEEKKLEENV